MAKLHVAHVSTYRTLDLLLVVYAMDMEKCIHNQVLIVSQPTVQLNLKLQSTF